MTGPYVGSLKIPGKTLVGLRLHHPFGPSLPHRMRKTQDQRHALLSLLFGVEGSGQADDDFGGLTLPVGNWGKGSAVSRAHRIRSPLEQGTRRGVALQGVR